MQDMPSGLLHFTIRPVRMGDEYALHTFYTSLSERSRFFFQPYSDTSADALRSIVERAVSGLDLSLVVCNPNGLVFGHVFFSEISKDVPHLGIGLLDAYQDHGLGAVLMHYLIRLGKYVLKKNAIGLTVVKENCRAFSLYKKVGFQVIGDVTFRSENDSYEMLLEYQKG